MKWMRFIVLALSVFLLSACQTSFDDFIFEFPSDVACNESAVDFVELDALAFPEEIDHGYLYSYVFDYGAYHFVFRNPDFETEDEEFLSKGAYGNQFFNDDGMYLRTEIPEGYYLYSVTFKYSSVCVDETDAENIATNLAKSFLYYSETDMTETEFTDAHADLFE